MRYVCLRGIFAALASLLAVSACSDNRQAMGTNNSIIVITTDSLWSAVGDSVLAAMEPRVFAVRDERTFEVTHVAPTDAKWTELRRFRQIVAIGTAEDGWVEPVLRRANAVGTGPGTVHRAEDVWARNQLATAVVVPAENSAEAVLSLVPQVATTTDSLFRVHALQRMYMSRADTLLRDTLRAEDGYGLLLPNVYRSIRRDANLQLFQNATQIGGDLVRSILVTSRPGLLEPTPELVLAWRDSMAAEAYRPTQAAAETRIETRELDVRGIRGFEVQGAWRGNDPTWPMGGPFIARVVHCPTQNRTFLLDAWLYAPNRGKYEYLIQLQTILDTFECAGDRVAAPRRGGLRYAALTAS